MKGAAVTLVISIVGILLPSLKIPYYYYLFLDSPWFFVYTILEE